VRRSAVSSYDIRKEGKRSDATRLKRGDASTALTVKGVEVVAEIRNLARGVELRCRGADKQCLGMEGEVATCSVVEEWRGIGGVSGRKARWRLVAGRMGWGSGWARGQVEEEEGEFGR
jgi:hypothetical protein